MKTITHITAFFHFGVYSKQSRYTCLHVTMLSFPRTLFLRDILSVACLLPSCQNGILDLFNFATLINELIKRDNDHLNVCNEIRVY